VEGGERGVVEGLETLKEEVIGAGAEGGVAEDDDAVTGGGGLRTTRVP